MKCGQSEKCLRALNNIPHDDFEMPEEAFTFIDAGSFGKVYKHQDSVTNSTVAIKVSKVQSKELTCGLLREIMIHKTLDSPHIVRYVGAHESKYPPKHHIVMEYMENKSLEQKLSEISDMNPGTIPVLKTVKILKYVENILNGLMYLHCKLSHQIAHRDLRADNVLLDADDTAKIADFGASKCVSEGNNSQIHSKVGNYLWLAPEILLDRKDHRGCGGDIWSLGIVILEMVFHQPDYFLKYTQDGRFCVVGESKLTQLHKDGNFRKFILKPLFKKITSRDTRTLLNECLVDNVPDRKTSNELLHLVQQMRSNRSQSNLLTL